MLYAKKANKYLKIDEKSISSYEKLGYDIVRIENNSEVTIAEGEGKTVSAKAMAEVVAENKKLKEAVEKSSKSKTASEKKTDKE